MIRAREMKNLPTGAGNFLPRRDGIFSFLL